MKFSVGCGTTGYATQWYDNATAAAGATPVPVAAGQATVSIDAVMTHDGPLPRKDKIAGGGRQDSLMALFAAN